MVINDNMFYGTNVIIECLKMFSPSDEHNNMEMHAKGRHEVQYGSKTGTSSLGSFFGLPVLGDLVGRPDYRLNTVLLRGIMSK